MERTAEKFRYLIYLTVGGIVGAYILCDEYSILVVVVVVV